MLRLKPFSDQLRKQTNGKAMRSFRTPSWKWRPNSFYKRAALRKTRRL